ncbi:MAG: tetratricopeptide repeat protein [Candidatus Eremiobacteraeota bacterium]|nr:tetratricopeptide repeat protein [Candidatus Eremiobacteraeota bacterium]MCW5872926.1 tetratricopeptide repeat protein [Candidatus Eremiobacteraeota bacterium]
MRMGGALWIGLLITTIGLPGCSGSPASQPTPTASVAVQSYLEQAEAHYQGRRYQEASAAALLAVEDTKADPAKNLKARTLLAVSESKLGSAPVAELRALSKVKTLGATERQRVQQELTGLKSSGLAAFKSARLAQKQKKYQQAIANAEKALKLFRRLGISQYDGDLKILLSRCYRATGDSAKAQEYLQQARPAVQTPQVASRPARRLRSDAKGNSILGSDGGLTLGISTEGYVFLSIEGSSRNAEIYMRRPEWQKFKTNYQEVRAELARFQNGGGSSRTVVWTDTDDLVLCCGTVLSSHGWQTRSSRPVLEVWICSKVSGSVTPWRARPYALPELIQSVDAYLKQLPTIP